MEIFNADGKSIEQKELNFGAGLSGYVMKNRQTLQLNNLQVERGKYIDSDRYKDPEFHSWLGVPLQFHEECVGIINVQSKIRNAYSEDNIRLMESIAQQATVAIQNAKLYELATIDG